ncbi:hypothetical protein D3C85_1558750 [compost metagenome]
MRTHFKRRIELIESEFAAKLGSPLITEMGRCRDQDGHIWVVDQMLPQDQTGLDRFTEPDFIRQ